MEIGITKDDATTDTGKDTTEIGMNGTTPQITTGEGTIGVIRNDKETGISDATKEEGISQGRALGSSQRVQSGTNHKHRCDTTGITETDDNNKMIADAQLGNTDKRESSSNRKIYCYYCQDEGHYNNQCPVKSNEKQPAVNMVTAEATDFQQVTTRSKGKAAEWETQENIRKQATEWINKANERNVAEKQEQNARLKDPEKSTDYEPTWQVLQECQIVLPLGRLLQLVPRFT